MEDLRCQDYSTHLSWHALARTRQRNFTTSEIDYVLAYGRMIRRTGICFYFLAARDIPANDKNNIRVQRLVGTTILVSAEGDSIITLYKNGKALRTIKKKQKSRSAA